MSFLNLFNKKEKEIENIVEKKRELSYIKEDENSFVATLKEQVVGTKQSKGVETPIREGDGLGFNSKISS